MFADDLGWQIREWATTSDKKWGEVCSKGRALQEKRIWCQSGGQKAWVKKHDFSQCFILMPGFKVQGVRRSRDFEGFVEGQSGRIREIKTTPASTLRKSQSAK